MCCWYLPLVAKTKLTTGELHHCGILIAHAVFVAWFSCLPCFLAIVFCWLEHNFCESWDPVRSSCLRNEPDALGKQKGISPLSSFGNQRHTTWESTVTSEIPHSFGFLKYPTTLKTCPESLKTNCTRCLPLVSLTPVRPLHSQDPRGRGNLNFSSDWHVGESV